MDATEALAESRAWIDGKLDEFRAGKHETSTEQLRWDYLADSATIMSELHMRGFYLAMVQHGL